MQAEQKKLVLAYKIGNETESSIVVTADANGVGSIWGIMVANVGTANNADETANIKIEARDFTSTDDGSTAYTTLVDTDDIAAWTLTSVASTNTEKTFQLNRGNAESGARWLRFTCNKSATGTASEVWLFVGGLANRAGTEASYTA